MIFCEKKRKELNDKTNHTMREHGTETSFATGKHDYLIKSGESEDDKAYIAGRSLILVFGLDLKH
jgi:hypothetical protein